MFSKFSVCKQKGGKTPGREIIDFLAEVSWGLDQWSNCNPVGYILEADLGISILKALLFVEEKALCLSVTQVYFKTLS